MSKIIQLFKSKSKSNKCKCVTQEIKDTGIRLEFICDKSEIMVFVEKFLKSQIEHIRKNYGLSARDISKITWADIWDSCTDMKTVPAATKNYIRFYEK